MSLEYSHHHRRLHLKMEIPLPFKSNVHNCNDGFLKASVFAWLHISVKRSVQDLYHLDITVDLSLRDLKGSSGFNLHGDVHHFSPSFGQKIRLQSHDYMAWSTFLEAQCSSPGRTHPASQVLCSKCTGVTLHLHVSLPLF
jgi:hypothetical protein